MSLDEGPPDLHLSIDWGDHSVRTQTEHIPPDNVDQMQRTEYVTSDTLYLSRRNLKDIDDSVLKTCMLKNLYLEGNQISSLPDSLFTSLSNLVWVDLRNNQISALPVEIGQHRSLKTLLLEGNPIKELPLELGTVITLRALSLRNCPILFPPQEIVEQGVQCILKFLRGAMVVRPVNVRDSLPDMPPVEKLQLAELVKSSLDLCEEVVNEDELCRFKELKQKMIQMDLAESGCGAAAALTCLPRAAQGEEGHRKYSLPVVKRSKEITKASIYPELPPFDMQYGKRSEERRLTAMKDLKEKQAILEQRRRDQELLREWRSHTKIMQERKILEHKQATLERQRKEEPLKTQMSNSEPQLSLTCSETATGLASKLKVYLMRAESVLLQSDSPTEAPAQLVNTQRMLASRHLRDMLGTPANQVSQKAPYATDPLVQDSVEVKLGNTQQSPQTHKTQKEAEEARGARDRELEHRIRLHVQIMQERRRRPKGTAEEETAAARHDMEEAKKLQKELDARKREKDREYRFLAYTGETSPSCDDK